MPKNAPSDSSYRKGVGLMIVNKERKIFLGKRLDGKKLNEKDTWQMPQGGIDGDESIENAAFRELHEETGIKSATIIYTSKQWLRYDIPSSFRNRFWDGRFKGQIQKWLLLNFLGDDSEIDIENNGDPEFQKWKWAEFSELPNSVINFKKELYLEVMREFKPIIKNM